MMLPTARKMISVLLGLISSILVFLPLLPLCSLVRLSYCKYWKIRMLSRAINLYVVIIVHLASLYAFTLYFFTMRGDAERPRASEIKSI